MKPASCRGGTRNPIDVMRACTGLTTAGMMIEMMVMMTRRAGRTAVTTYIQVGDLSTIDVQVAGHVPATGAVVCCHSGGGFRLHRQIFPSTTANCSLEQDHIN
jgi:hypothetical protein